MKFNITKFHNKSIEIFDRENLGEFKQRVVAFVLDSKGHILTTGWNSYLKTHTKQKRAALGHKNEHRCFLHAEVRALTRLTYKQAIRAETIVVIRMGKDKSLMPGKPCPICSDVIRDYDIKNIIHS